MDVCIKQKHDVAVRLGTFAQGASLRCDWKEYSIDAGRRQEMHISTDGQICRLRMADPQTADCRLQIADGRFVDS